MASGDAGLGTVPWARGASRFITAPSGAVVSWQDAVPGVR